MTNKILFKCLTTAPSHSQYRLSSILFLIVITVLCSMIIAMSDNQSYVLSTALVIPVISVFLLSFKWGAVYSIVYFVVFAWLCIHHLNIWQHANFTKISFFQLTLTYIILFAIACIYDLDQLKSQRRLTEANKKLEKLACTDMLTGLKNRRHLEKVLLNSTNKRLFAMIDVDDFKKVNDLYGHNEGDRVLSKLSQIMTQSFGESNDIIRWGGEEFAVVYYGKSKEDFINQLSKMQAKIAHYDFGLNAPVTLSVGAGVFYPSKYKSSLKAIDNALYRAKEAGKNCLRFAYAY